MDLEDEAEAKSGGAPDYGPSAGYGPVLGEGPRRTDSPLPAPMPQRPLPKQSLDGETLFAVGDDDKDRNDSDSDDDDMEDKRLRGKSD